MEPVENVAAVLHALNELGVPYMIVGSLSSNFYGEPRNTHDADLVVQLGDKSLSKLMEIVGPGFTLDRQMGFETITGTTRYHIQHVDSEFLIELFELTNDPHNQERFVRRRKTTFLGVPAYVATAEDVVIQKLRWYLRGRRPKDIEDVKNVMEGKMPDLDLGYIRSWCDRHGTRELLEETLRSIPPLPENS
jgi:predicted nucleotidyltransferase